MIVKLAVIDYKYSLGCLEFLDYLKKFKKIECFHSSNLENFKRGYGRLGNYDFLLLHPGREMKDYYLIKISKKYPDLKFGFVSADTDVYIESDVPMFGYGRPKQIVNFFIKKGKSNYT